MPSPQPSPTGEGAGCSGFRCYRSSEKECPKTSTAGIFQAAFIVRQMEQTPRAFFQTTFEPIGRMCAARHARGGLELQGKWGARAYHTRPTCVATACLDLPLIVGRLKRKKAANTTCFSYRTLNPNSHSVLSPRGRELERGQQAARLVFGRLVCWERLPKFGEHPLPNPPPQGREQIAAGFAVAGGLKSNLDLQPLISGRLKSKKQSAQPIFLAKPLIPTATPSSLPWERARERATSRKVCMWAVRVLGKIAVIWGNVLSPTLPHGGGSGLQRI